MVLWKLKQRTESQIIDLLRERIQRSREHQSETYHVNVTMEHVKKAIEGNLKKDLRYNDITGTTYRGKEWVGKYTKKSDIQKYSNIDEVIEWQFAGIILNDAQRLASGHKLS
jgi:hypothetical protein